VLVPKQKLAVQVAEVNRVQVNDVDLAKAREHQILQQFAANASGSHHENTRLLDMRLQRAAETLSRKLVACHCRHRGAMCAQTC